MVHCQNIGRLVNYVNMNMVIIIQYYSVPKHPGIMFLFLHIYHDNAFDNCSSNMYMAKYHGVTVERTSVVHSFLRCIMGLTR